MCQFLIIQTNGELKWGRKYQEVILGFQTPNSL